MSNAKLNYVLIPCGLMILIPFLIALLFVGCLPANLEAAQEVISFPEESKALHPGDTLIIRDQYIKDIHIQEIGIYHGGPVGGDEHLALYK